MHTCDNPACVNPEHLRVGTQADNMRDKASKRRCGVTGKLTPDQVRAIRNACTESEKRQFIADRFGVSVNTIYDIQRRKTWRHLDDD